VSKEWRHTSSPKLKKFCTQSSAGKVRLTLFWDERGVILEHYMPRGNTVTSAYADLLKNQLHPAIKSKQHGKQVFCSNMTMLSPILPIPLLQQSKICPLSVFYICCTRQTSPPVNFMSLDRSKKQWEASLSGPTKRCSRHEWLCSRQKEFFSRGMHALPKCSNTCMERNGDYIHRKMKSLCTFCVQ